MPDRVVEKIVGFRLGGGDDSRDCAARPDCDHIIEKGFQPIPRYSMVDVKLKGKGANVPIGTLKAGRLRRLPLTLTCRLRSGAFVPKAGNLLDFA